MANQEFLGFGLVRPLRRDQQRDFVAAGDEALVKAAVGQILGTVGASDFTQGELPWRPELGSLLHLLRHYRNTADNPTLRELARHFVAEALQRFEPRIEVADVELPPPPPDRLTQLTLKLRYSIIDRNVPGNQVLLGPVVQEVTI